MSKPNVPLTISNLKTLDDVIRYNSIVFDAFLNTFTGNISFTDNIFVSRVDLSFTGANTETIVNHTLKVIPTGYIKVRSSAAMEIYDSSVNLWNKGYIYVKSSAIGTATILVFA